jgi:methylenetetrahydrofolate dehydrogenase (NADP+) / methenyltetrahydrofolate cyclohydrolase
MAARIIDGKAIAAAVREGVRDGVHRFREETGVQPGLSVVLVGEDPASQSYIRGKVRAAQELGIASKDHLLPESTSEAELLSLIRSLNADPAVHGILVQLPLPAHIRKDPVLEAVDPRKDVDGFHPFNVGRLVLQGTPMPPCTPAGILEILDRSGVELRGAEAVVVGRSLIVGKPVAFLLLHRDATVTLCHSRTRDLPGVCRRADVLIAAVGRPRMIDASYVKPGAVVIDVGMNRIEDPASKSGTRLVGDVDFEGVRHVASLITPVPRGVGPMTIAMLLRNTVRAAQRSLGV